jgi:hypothetical protein
MLYGLVRASMHMIQDSHRVDMETLQLSYKSQKNQGSIHIYDKVHLQPTASKTVNYRLNKVNYIIAFSIMNRSREERFSFRPCSVTSGLRGIEED